MLLNLNILRILGIEASVLCFAPVQRHDAAGVV